MNLYYIDLFCGAGGLSTGVDRAGGKVIACINHDALAIQSHKANHKEAIHFTEDITTFDVSPLILLVKRVRENDPEAIICLWASLECIHFSKAKGGDSRDADSRTLAEHLYRYIQAIDPDYIDVENVTEFMSWGPLRIACESHYQNSSVLKVLTNRKRIDKQGHPYHLVPVSKKNGIYYRRWKDHICELFGYEYDHRILNAADFGAITSRIRYFGQFKKPHFPFTWPEPTHAKDPGKYGGIGYKLKKWLPVRPALDLEDKGKSIFGRNKPLSENTLKRIYAGLVKHVAHGQEPEFLTKWMSGNNQNKSTESPAWTLTTMNHFGIIQTEFLMKYFSGRPNGKVKSVNEPIGTVTSFGGGALVNPEFIHQRNSGDPKTKVPSVNEPSRTLTKTGGNLDVVFISKYYGGDYHHYKSINDPSDTITTKDHHSMVFLNKYYGTGITHDVDKPADTLTTKDRLGIVSVVWLDKQFRSELNHQDIDRPAGSILTNDKHCKVSAILINNYSGNILDEPSPTLLASRRHYYLLNPQFKSKGSNLENPCFTLIARMDKAPPYIVDAESIERAGDVIPCILIYNDESEIMKKIKIFMATHGIVDIKMRMLKIPELLRIQGFGDKYILKGTQTDQKRFIGNAVEVTLAKCKVAARRDKLKNFQINTEVA